MEPSKLDNLRIHEDETNRREKSESVPSGESGVPNSFQLPVAWVLVRPTLNVGDGLNG